MPPSPKSIPRHERQFPFIAEDESEREAVRRDIGKAIEGCWPMLHKLARQHHGPKAKREDIEDAVQDVALKLATYSLPRYDSTAGTKVTTFIHLCASRELFHIAGKKFREIRRHIGNGKPRGPDKLLAPNTQHDREVERVADAILADPRAMGFSKREAAAIKALTAAGPGVQRRQVASELGYRRSQSLNRYLMTARKRIADSDFLT